METLTVELPRGVSLYVSREAFAAIAAANRDLRLERTANGQLVVSPPTGGESGRRNLSISAQLWNWVEAHRDLGVAFDSSTGFALPDRGTRAPDAAWVARDRWDALTREQRQRFVPLAPDFAIDLRSESDTLSTLQDKMREYLASGTRLAWLVDPQNQRVEIYRRDREVEIVKQPVRLSGEDVLPDFTLELRDFL